MIKAQTKAQIYDHLSEVNVYFALAGSSSLRFLPRNGYRFPHAASRLKGRCKEVS